MTFGSWVAADGWPLRSFRWRQNGSHRGSILFLNGRGDFIEKYLEPLIHWHEQGWDLAGFDWRGQGGSGRLLPDPMICHQMDFDPLVDDLAGFVAQWRQQTPPPHVIIAHSMGAHLTLRLLARGNEQLDAAILVSPMIGIRVAGVPSRLVKLLAQAAVRLGLSHRRVSSHDIGNTGGRMTSCPERRSDKAWWKTSNPAIASGPPSWGWVDAAFTSIAHLPASALRSVTVPILLIAPRQDPVIDVGAIGRAVTLLPQAQSTIFEGGGHELLREADSRRLPVMGRIDRFLDEVGASSPGRSVGGPA